MNTWLEKQDADIGVLSRGYGDDEGRILAERFPKVTLVVIVNADSGLYSGDFRAFEQTAQQIIQVADELGIMEKRLSSCRYTY